MSKFKVCNSCGRQLLVRSDGFKKACPICGGTTFSNKEYSPIVDATKFRWCNDCGRRTEISALTDGQPCSGCGSFSFRYSENANRAVAAAYSQGNASKSIADAQQTSEPKSEMQTLIELQRETIHAINKTTHAVRAFVLFLFYQLAAITAAYFIYQIAIAVGSSRGSCSYEARLYGTCDPNALLTFIAVVIWFGGIYYSSKKGWEEIAKSSV